MVIGDVVLDVVEAEMEVEVDEDLEEDSTPQVEVEIINLSLHMATSFLKPKFIVQIHFGTSPFNKRKKFSKLRRIKV